MKPWSLLSFVVVLFFYVLYNVHTAELPAMKINLSSAGVNNIATALIPTAIAHIESSKIAIPDSVQRVSTPLGHVHVWLTNGVLSNVRVAKWDVQFVAGVGVEADFSGLSSVINIDWKWKTDGIIKISDHGSATITITQAAVGTEVAIGVGTNGKPTATDAKNLITLGTWDLTLHSHYDWFYDLFKKTLLKDIESGASAQIDKQMTSEINAHLASVLATLPFPAPINDVVEINYAFEQNPVVSASSIAFETLGEFELIKTPHAPPFVPKTALPDSMNSGYMLQIIMSDFVYNSLGYAYWESGLLSFTVDHTMVPPDSPITLNTSSWQTIVPPLYKYYPNLWMEIIIDSHTYPTTILDTEGVNETLPGYVTFQVVLPNNTRVTAFTVATTVGIGLTLGINDAVNNITGKVVGASVDTTLVSSNIGTFPTTNLAQVIKLVTLLSMGAVNNLLAVGYPLPILPEMKLINPVLQFENGYVGLLSNFNYVG